MRLRFGMPGRTRIQSHSKCGWLQTGSRLVNKAWERNPGDIQVKLSSRVILSPFAAKRMAMLLNNVMQQYEARFGHMDVGTIRTNDQVETS